MKDKEKQIEEMAKVNCDKCSFCDNCDKCKFAWHDDCEKIKNATALYNAGYRKLPEDSVIISQKEYDALKTIEKYRIKSCGKDSVVLSKEEAEELRQEIITLNQELVNSRKETAEKILYELNHTVNKNAIKVNRDCYENCGFIYMVDCGDVALCLDKLAKQFGVEIKE